MAEEKKAPDPSAKEDQGPPPPRSPFPFLPLLNLLAILGVLGFFYYSKFVFKRPRITEDKERDRLVAKKEEHPPVSTLLIPFEPMTVNISPAPIRQSPADIANKQIRGKLHIATIGFSLEIRDPEQKDLIESLRPFILDKIIFILGKKQLHELVTVQGRYILHSQLIEMVNQLVSERSEEHASDDLVTNLYFSQFTVQ